MPVQPTCAAAFRKTVAFLLGAVVLSALLAGCKTAPKAEGDLALMWKNRLNLLGPSPPSTLGNEGERLLLVDAQVEALVVPFGRPLSLQEDRAKVVLKPRKSPEGLSRPLGRVELWCPDSVLRDRGWQVGQAITLRLLPDLTLYDVVKRP